MQRMLNRRLLTILREATSGPLPEATVVSVPRHSDTRFSGAMADLRPETIAI